MLHDAMCVTVTGGNEHCSHPFLITLRMQTVNTASVCKTSGQCMNESENYSEFTWCDNPLQVQDTIEEAAIIKESYKLPWYK